MEKLVLPLEEEFLWKMIEEDRVNTDTFEISVKDSFSNLGDSFLYYISNLGLKCVLNFDGCSFNERSSILEQYFSLNRVLEQEQLEKTMCSVMFRYRYLPIDKKSFLTEDEVCSWIKSHLELVAKSAIFLDSIILYTLWQFDGTNEYFDKENYQKVEDTSIPLNLVTLFKYSDFLLYYSTSELDNLFWFENQFLRPLYQGTDIGKFVFVKDNLLSAICYGLSEKLKEIKNVPSV